MDRNKRNFDTEAATWENPPRIKLANDVAGAMLKQLRLSKDMDVLDFGAGTGLIALQFAPHVRSVTGVDTSMGMLEVFQHKAKELSLNNVTAHHLQPVGALDLPRQYHLVTSSMTLHHVEDIQGLVNKFHVGLLPGGYVALADLDEEGGQFHENNDGVFHFGFNRTKLAAILKAEGFSDICCMTAAQMTKPGVNGHERIFNVFLMTGKKPFRLDQV